MLDDDEIDAGTKAGKKPSGFFHFRNDPPLPSCICWRFSCFVSFVEYMDENGLIFIVKILEGLINDV